MSKQLKSPSEIAMEAYRAGQYTIDILERAEKVVAETPVDRSWSGRAWLFFFWLFGTPAPIPPNINEARKLSRYYGLGQWDYGLAPIGAVHWCDNGAGGIAAVEMGPMGMLTVGPGTNGRVASDIGLISHGDFRGKYLGWSLDYAGSEPLLTEQIVFRGQ